MKIPLHTHVNEFYLKKTHTHTENNNVGENVHEFESLCTAGINVKW